MPKNKAVEEWKEKKFGRVTTEEDLESRTSEVWPYEVYDPGRPVESSEVEELRKGIIDIHAHGAPMGSFLQGRPSMLQTCIEASEAGMRAIVFKDHNTMTCNVAYIIQEALENIKKEREKREEIENSFTPVEAYGGTVLNSTVGGLNPKAVEAALGYEECKTIWLPSLDSWHQNLARGAEGGIIITENDHEKLKPEMEEILEILADYNKEAEDRCPLGACHISNEEKFALLDYVEEVGLDVDIIIDHVTQELTVATPEEAKEMIDKGAYLQFAKTSTLPWNAMKDWVILYEYTINLIKELIDEKGPEQLNLVTDAGQPTHKPVEAWWHFLRALLSEGISKKDINIMAKEVPAKLLGLET